MCEHFIESGADHTDQENDNNKYYLILLSIFIGTFFLIDCTDKTESSKGVTNTCYMLSPVTANIIQSVIVTVNIMFPCL